MKLFIRFGIVILIIIAAGFLTFFMFVFRFGFLHYNTKEFVFPIQIGNSSWDEIFKNGKEMELVAFKTGYAAAGPNARPYLNLESLPPDFNIDKEEVSPIYFYCLRHPEQGDLLIDAGLDNSFFEKPPFGSLHSMLKMYQNKTKTFYKQEIAKNTGYWLDKYGIGPGTVFLTHLHPDHICGLLELNETVKVVFGKKENNFYYRAISGKYLGCKKLFTIDFNKGVPIYPFSKTIDVFGDGSVWAISTPGHTINHVSYLLNIKNNPVFLIGDLCCSKDYLMNNIESSCDDSKAGIQKLRNSLKEVKEFKKMHPEVKIYFSHSDEIY